MSKEIEYKQKKFDDKEHFLFRSMYHNIPSSEEKYYPTHAYVGFKKEDLSYLSEEEKNRAMIMTYINIYKYDNML